MSISCKKIASIMPANTNEAELVGATEVASGEEVIVTVTVCNQDSQARTCRMALCDTNDGTAAANDDFLWYDKSIPATDSRQITGITVTNGQSIRIKASAANVLSFVAYGQHIS